MAWHQGLHDPIPNFQLTLNSDTDEKPKVTWGDVKSLVSAAQQQLLRSHQEPTPDNLLVAEPPGTGQGLPPLPPWTYPRTP
uniref:Uncharacterized protein n=1 Tax=Pelusios castaneus TaxID=367368 RepID=A0A8C8SND3_9SAUR